jgi:hypothetical protein
VWWLIGMLVIAALIYSIIILTSCVRDYYTCALAHQCLMERSSAPKGTPVPERMKSFWLWRLMVWAEGSNNPWGTLRECLVPWLRASPVVSGTPLDQGNKGLQLYVFLSTMVSESHGLAACGHGDLPLKSFESDQVLFRNLTSIAGLCFESPEDMYVAYRIALVRMRLQGNIPVQFLAGPSQPGGEPQPTSLVSQSSKGSNIRSFPLLLRAGSGAGVSSPTNRSPFVMLPSVSSNHTAGDSMALASSNRVYATADSARKPDPRPQHLSFL